MHVRNNDTGSTHIHVGAFLKGGKEKRKEKR